MPHPIAQFLNIRAANSPAPSPDGREVAFLSNLTGLPQPWVVASDSGWPRRVAFTPDAVRAIGWSPDGLWLHYVMDSAGDEQHQLYLVRPDGTENRALTADPTVRYAFGDWLPDSRAVVYAANTRDRRFFDLYLHPLDGEPRVVYASDDTNLAGPVSPDGTQVAFSRVRGSFDADIHVLDLASGEERCVTPHEGTAHFGDLTWAPDGRSLLLLTDLDDEFVHLVRVDLETLQREVVYRETWDLENLALAPDGTVAFTVNREGYSDLMLLRGGQVTRLTGLPLGVIAGVSFSRDGRRLTFQLDGPRHPSDVWACEPATGRVWQVTFSDRAGIPETALAQPGLVRYPTFDRRDIPAWHYHPTGPANGATILWIHGGPESQTRANFNPVLAFLVDRGYAVLAPNVRGSTGYGKTYHHLDDVRRRMDSVADAAAAVDWLLDQGAERERIVCLGGSYGGFMVLSLVTEYPKLWAAGVDLFGISNFVTFLEHTGPYRRKLRESEYGSLEEDGEFLREISPIHHVERVRCPMFILQGATDPRVPKLESDQMVERLRERGVPVEYVVFEDEGHGLLKLENRITAYTAIAEFLDRTLGE